MDLLVVSIFTHAFESTTDFVPSKYIITTPNQLTATALILQEWKHRDEVNPGVWIAVFLVAICAINYFGIKFFGELEFWLSTIKVITIVRIA